MLPYHRKLLSAVGGGNYEVQAVTFDGANDYLERTSDLVGNADGAEITISVWVKTSVDATHIYVSGTGASGVLLVEINSANNFSLSESTNPSIQTTGTNLATGQWVHIICSVNGTTGEEYVYINNSLANLSSSQNSETSIDFTQTNHTVGANTPGVGLFDGDMAELYIAHEYIDLSVTANRRKFISANSKPVNLGADGSIPTGNQPIIYLSNSPGDAASAFATNRGTGGNFSITGALAVASTSPSD